MQLWLTAETRRTRISNSDSTCVFISDANIEYKSLRATSKLFISYILLFDEDEEGNMEREGRKDPRCCCYWRRRRSNRERGDVNVNGIELRFDSSSNSVPFSFPSGKSGGLRDCRLSSLDPLTLSFNVFQFRPRQKSRDRFNDTIHYRAKYRRRQGCSARANKSGVQTRGTKRWIYRGGKLWR